MNPSENMSWFGRDQTLFITPGNLSRVQETVTRKILGMDEKYGFNLPNTSGKTFMLYFINKGIKKVSRTPVTINL